MFYRSRESFQDLIIVQPIPIGVFRLSHRKASGSQLGANKVIYFRMMDTVMSRHQQVAAESASLVGSLHLEVALSGDRQKRGGTLNV